ncbi:undecaprenyl-diphosphate phosphatase [Ornithinibacillus contaminans]|uniref:undecaprenyl-diphosphate phosphatase n=1 Tax=Ornithinibacillus contaminans TaxID=694055 RepID=UPI00064E0CB3|nr:undecaprenyl-diphosphate phosphatase [Ornithinibacillus contaminans]
MEILNLVKAIILGLVEGLTEFAPVSSTGHLIIVDDLWLHSKDFLREEVANSFFIVVQLGSILAVVVVFFNRFLDLLGLKPKSYKIDEKSTGHLNLAHIIVGLLPAAILGLLFKDFIDKYLFDSKYVIYSLIAGAILMIFADKIGSNRNRLVETVDQITYRQAFYIGLFQCLSLWPGFSRSGATISGGVLLGLSHRAASDFTFIMAVPIMAGANFISLLDNWKYFTPDVLPFFIVGFLSSFIFALVCIRFFLKLINKIKLRPFAIYRIVLAIILIILLY